MLFLIFFYVLAAVLFFQGMHLLGEVEEPLGTLPEEVAQAPVPSRTWGAYLMTFGAAMVVTGLSSLWCAYLEPTLKPLQFLALLSLGAYAAWVIFRGRTVVFIGEPTQDDHDHGHAHH